MAQNPTTQIVEIPSASTPGQVYVVSRRGDYVACTCPGFVHRGRCKHLVFAPARRDPAPGASLYNHIWADDERPAPPRVPLLARLQA